MLNRSIVTLLALATIVSCSPRNDDSSSIEEPPGTGSTDSPPEVSYPGEDAGTAVPEALTPTPPEPSAPPPADAVRVYLVDLEAGAAAEDGEPAADSFGCGDRLRAVEVPVATEGLDTAGRVAAALGALLGGEATPAGLYDVFARSRLAVESVEAVPGVPGVFRVQLTGDLLLGGVCDHPRVRAQLEATARQFEGVEEVEILLAGRPLDAHLTGR